MRKFFLVLLLCTGCTVAPQAQTAEFTSTLTASSSPSPSATRMPTVTFLPTLPVAPSTPEPVPLIPINTPQTAQAAEFYESFDPNLGSKPDPSRWSIFTNAGETFLQKDGYVRLTGAGNTENQWTGQSLAPSSFFNRPLRDLGLVEAKMRLPSDGQGGDILLNMNIEKQKSDAQETILCNVSVTHDKQPFLSCGVVDRTTPVVNHSYPILYNRWYTLRIEIDPVSLRVFFFVDGEFLASEPLSVEGWGDPHARYKLGFFSGQFAKGFGVVDLDEVVIKKQPEWSALAATPTPLPTAGRPPELPLVQIRDNNLVVDNQPFRFVGANSIQFPEYRFLGMNIDDVMRTAAENNLKVVRAFMRYYGPGTLDMELFDRYLDSASRNGIYVIVTLADCDPGPFRNDPAGFALNHPFCLYTDRQSMDEYRRFIADVLSRRNSINGRIYRDDTTVLAWDIANEPDFTGLTGQEVQDWIRQIAGFVRQQDPDTPVTLGINAIQDNFNLYEVMDVPELDLVSFHFYNYWTGPYDPNSVPAYLDKLKGRIDKFQSFGKPVILEEFGMSSDPSQLAEIKSTPQGWQQYIDFYRQAFDTAFSEGVSGILFWGWSPPGVSQLPVFWAIEEHSSDDVAFAKFLRNYLIAPSNVP